jgi:putative intracellular protease/amidase
MKLKIAMLLASDKFRDCEYLVPRAFFEQAGFEIITISSKHIATGRFGFSVKVDQLIDSVTASEFDGIFFVGGGGSLEYKDNPRAENLFRAFLQVEKPIAAICAAPRNFLKWGLLVDKKATGYDVDGVFSTMAEMYGAEAFPEQKTIIDGLILTANGPEASEECALAFIKLVSKK